MSASSLKHYAATNPASANTVFDAMGAAVPATRALVVSKIVVVSAVAQTVALYLGSSATSTTVIAWALSLSAGQVYTETGLVVLAGERIYAQTNNAVATNLVVAVFGEEVDN